MSSRVKTWLDDNNEKRLKEYPAQMNMLNCKQLKAEMDSLQECVNNIKLSAYGMVILQFYHIENMI